MPSPVWSSSLEMKLGEASASCLARLLPSQTADSAWEDARTVALGTLSLPEGSCAT